MTESAGKERTLKAVLGEKLWFYGLLPNLGSINVFLLIAIYAGICLIGYLLGSVNTAILVSKIMYGEDIRTKGSGNAGMTNMMRTYGKGPAAITFAGDLMKTLIAMTVGTLVLGLNAAYFAGFFAILGHIAPVFHKFKGGKGVSAAAMFILYADPLAFLVVFVIFAIIVGGIKFLSLGSIICAFIFPYIVYSFENAKLNAFVQANPDLPIEAIPYLDLRFVRLLIMLLISFTIIFMHRSNIKRLMSGTESKFSFKKTQKPMRSGDGTAADGENGGEKKRSLHNIDVDEN